MKVRSDRNAAEQMLRLLLLVLLSSITLQVSALSSDRQQPIQVEADSLEVREMEKISIYSGNVHLKQGSLEISSEQLTLFFNDNKEITMMKLTGSPATFRQLDDLQQEIHGEGEQIEYNQSESTLILLDNARVTHVGDTIESNKIQIDTITGGMKAGGTNSEDRVRMLIQPTQE